MGVIHEYLHSLHPASNEKPEEARARRMALAARAKLAVPELMRTGNALPADEVSPEEIAADAMGPTRVPVARECECFGCVCICDYRRREDGWLEKTYATLVEAVDAMDACREGSNYQTLDPETNRLRVIPRTKDHRAELARIMGPGVEEKQHSS